MIVLSNGTWRDFDLVLEAEGTAENPIYLVAEEPGEVILSGQSSLRIGGRHLIVSGLVFRDGYTPRNEVISFRRDSETLAFNSRVTRTVIENYNNPDRAQRDTWVVMYGQNNAFDHNHLSGKLNSGPTMIDAPLGRTPAHAKDGLLNIMAAGDKATFDKYEPILKEQGENVFYLGKLGAGHTTKLINNFMRQQRPGCCQSNAKPSPASCGIGLLSSEQPTPFREGDVSHRFECRAVVEVAV